MRSKVYHQVITGSAAQIGITQARLIKEHNLSRFAVAKRKLITKKDFARFKDILKEFVPYILDELEAFAKEFNCQITNLKFLKQTWLKPNCSHFVVPKTRMKDKQVYVGRNYDFNNKFSDNRLCTTRIDGKYAHIGFSTMFFGRQEGMNEKGLCVTFSSCGIPTGYYKGMVMPKTEGLQFWIVTRILLENCKDVDEATELIQRIPIATNANFLLADKSGRKVLVETFEGETYVEFYKDNDFALATNHALVKKVKDKQNLYLKNSKVRFDKMKNTFDSGEELNVEHLKELLSTKYPKGLSCSYYSEFFGTLYSIIFCPEKSIMYLRLGAEPDACWNQIGFNSSERSYDVVYSKSKSPEGFWDIE